MLILIPLPLFFAQTVYGVQGYSAWVVIGIIWCFTSAISVVIYPLWESRDALRQISSGIIKVQKSPMNFTATADVTLSFNCRICSRLAVASTMHLRRGKVPDVGDDYGI